MAQHLILTDDERNALVRNRIKQLEEQLVVAEMLVEEVTADLATPHKPDDKKKLEEELGKHVEDRVSLAARISVLGAMLPE
jgi:hypothetical protein